MELSKEGIKFTDETLDVGLCSPLDGQEEGEPDVYLVEPSEKCGVQAVDINVFLGESKSSHREQDSQWFLLSPEKLEEVMKEANILASQLERCQLRENGNGSCFEIGLETLPEFEPLSPIKLLHEERPSFRKTRRKTFDVKNSPLKALLPMVGPETCLAHDSLKGPPKQGGQASCSMGLPSTKKLQNKSKTYSAEDQLSKKSGARQSFKASTVMKSGTKKVQATNRSSRKDKLPPLSFCDGAQHQQSQMHLKPLPRTNRKTEGTGGKDGPFEEPQAFSVACVKGKPDPRLFPPETKSLKKSLVAPEKAVPLQKANANHSKTMRGDSPQLQPNSKPHRGSCRIQSSRSVTSPLASRLPILKATSRPTHLGRHAEAVSGRPSQLQQLNLGVPGGTGSVMPIPARKKASAFQQTAPSGLSQNSRLRLRKKTTSENSS
ncbi:proline/serine-rich coiled-coil protein 1 isoform X1 [Sceloporus undulatus]|uniref:proline/serine-rich coiled-coil protein 1 isoform X1 n=1 Tax=Sceloporus undulatus TaxID=8520 RepID=UPI001C4C50EC|nr:proline/serine-rich coiled-coil protein 1 isoform X1 [Sceloporus undulatus]